MPIKSFNGSLSLVVGKICNAFHSNKSPLKDIVFQNTPPPGNPGSIQDPWLIYVNILLFVQTNNASNRKYVTIYAGTQTTNEQVTLRIIALLPQKGHDSEREGDYVRGWWLPKYHEVRFSLCKVKNLANFHSNIKLANALMTVGRLARTSLLRADSADFVQMSSLAVTKSA